MQSNAGAVMRSAGESLAAAAVHGSPKKAAARYGMSARRAAMTMGAVIMRRIQSSVMGCNDAQLGRDVILG